ncbi:phage tail tape measure protein, lambda family [Paraburkholderia fungorum]|uniref:Phage tail tape measure protein, lambda family n=1 Tax=Paraburkholderia fungorum TaxID=134537 RepID=A0A1H1H245_9BURK|nr:phage tail tape measure protein [Paraburkholderia fungorum]SDR19158.1 phage tail tape measure protein, lambda family [Paraburkholderia fungorum]
MQTQDQAAQRVAVAQKAISEAAVNGSQASTREINSFVSSLTRAADTAGKTRSELLAMKAAQLGISDAAAESVAKLKAVEEASNANSEAAHGFSLNSAAARRELAVLAHEASQGSWKNFGGSLMVLAERTDALSVLMSPLGIAIGAAAGAVALMIHSISEGASQYDAFQKSIVSTNGALGLSAEQMINISNTLNDSKTSLSAARETLASLADTGRFAGDDLALAGRAAVAMSEDTGVSADQAVESMVKLHDNILEWLAAYQEQHHTFSAAQVDEIEGFVRAGDAAAAQKAVMLDLISAHEQVAASAKTQTGFIAQGWRDIVEVVTMYKNMIMNIGVPDGITKQVGDQLARVEAAQRNLDQLQGGSSFSVDAAKQQLAVETEKLNVLRDQQAVQFKTQQAAEKRATGGDAAVAVNKYLGSTQYASPLDQRNLAIKKENADFAEATKDLDKTATDFVAAEKRHVDNLAQIDKQYQSRNGSKAAASAAAAAAQNAISAQLAALDQQQKDIETKLKTSLDHIKSLQDQGLITQEDALQQMHDARSAALQDELKIEQQEVEIAQGKKQKAAIEKYAGEVKTTQDKIAANDQQFTDDSGKLAAKRAADLKVYTDALQQQLATQQSAADQTLAGLSMGTNDRADYDKLLSLRQDYDRKVADLTKQRTTNQIGPQQYADELAATQDYYDKSVAIAQKSSADIRAANADWTTGAKRALADYSDEAANVAASTASTFQDAFRGMEDAFAKFVTTGKLSFSDLATSVISDIARMQARAVISGLFNYAASAIGSYFGGSTAGATVTAGESSAVYAATGGHVTGPGSATSDSIPAWLSNGEYVMSAAAVQRIGIGNLDAANSGRSVHGAARFASGGYVGAASSTTSSRGGDISISAPVSVQGGSDPSANASNAAQLQKQITDAVKAVVAKERKQGGTLWKMQQGIK